ncbi:MAG: N-acetylneuraminate synthase [Thermoanaerobaculia bacterium]
MLKALFIVPARGGSKGLPGKNLSPFAGIPLVGQAVRVAAEAARTLGAGSRVLCSTDDETIAAIALAWGAEVPFLRPAALATDEARSADVVLHALDAFGDDFEAVVLLQPTSPLTAVDDVVAALRMFRETGDPVVSVCAVEHPLEWSFRIDEFSRLTPFLPAEGVDRRQDAARAVRPNGAVYVTSPARLRRDGTFWTAETRGHLMPRERSVDIDTPADLAIARAMLTMSPPPVVDIGGRKVGVGSPCFVIAEAGVNHNGNVEMAIRLIDAAVEAGADAVKFQTFRAESLVTQGAPKAVYQLRTTDRDESQIEMIRRLELSQDDHRVLIDHCRSVGMMFLSSPFDEASADFLEDLGVPAYKIPSGEITNHPFLMHLARKRKPLILSTGMANMQEVAGAVAAIRATAPCDLILLQCVSNYPADPAHVNLAAMETMGAAYGVAVGYSDHVPRNEVSLAAVARGACVIEKHFTLDRSLPGPDHAASLEPSELAALVEGIRVVEQSIGNGLKVPAPSEAGTADVARKSLVAARDLPAGTMMTVEMLLAKRPGTGISPARFNEVLGRTLSRAYAANELLRWEDLR